MKRVSTFVLFFLGFARVYAQSLLEYYDSELVIVKYQTFGGLCFFHGGVSYLAAFGLEQQLRDIIASHPQTAPLIEKHVRNIKTGWIFTLTGILATTAVAYLASPMPLAKDEDFAWRLAAMIGLGAYGTISVIAGPFFMQAGYSNISQAVNIYNRDKIQQYK